ncbi:SIS domain-containing protein [Agrobacterium tumefaciens]|nr:SIS domain-containing protein [Agrobacterium tumefaciens]
MSNPEIEASISKALGDIASRKAVSNIYFVACGGSFAQMHASKFVVDKEAKTISAEAYSSAEFIVRNPARLGPDSIVVLCSKSGDTPETVEAAKFAKAKGAYVIGMTAFPESPLAKTADTAIIFVTMLVDASPDMTMAIILRVTFGILREREGNEKHKALQSSLANVAGVVSRLQEAHARDAAEWASRSKRESLIYTVASGANYGVAYNFAICLLQEMQWVHSQAIHSGEYFHGPFEVTDHDVPFFILLGLGDTRPVDERALAFARKYSEKVVALDAASFDLEGLEASVLEYVLPIVFLQVMRIYAMKLSDERGHPLTVRRYMWKMAY